MSTAFEPFAAQLSPVQLQFFRSLCRPFHPDDIAILGKGGKELSWVAMQILMNRLDDVAGPHGWRVEYTATERGQKARLWIRVPTEDPETGITEWAWEYREDGGGDAGMASEDDDEKSGYTDAFKRVCMAWGINRALWGKGTPRYLDGIPHDDRSYYLDGQGQGPAPRQPSQRPPQQQRGQPPRQQDNTPSPAPSNANGRFNNFQLPKAGKSAFVWAKKMEEHYSTTIVKGMKDQGEKLGYGGDIYDWNQDESDYVCRNVIAYLKSLDNYKGEFDHIQAVHPGDVEQQQAESPPGQGLRALKGKVMETAKRVASATLGREASQNEVMHSVKTTASDVNNGTVLVSLKECNDADWLRRIIERLEKIEQAKKQQEERKKATVPASGDDDLDALLEDDDDIPF